MENPNRCICVPVSMPLSRAEQVEIYAKQIGIPVSRVYQRGIDLLLDAQAKPADKPRNRRAKSA